MIKIVIIIITIIALIYLISLLFKKNTTTSEGFQSSNWRLLGSDIDGDAAGDNSGGAIALSSNGRILAIGADSNDTGGNNSGHVRIFEYNMYRQVKPDACGFLLYGR